MRLLSLITSLFLSITLLAQIEDPVDWSFESKHLGDGEFELIATATIEKGWFIYSQDLAEDGPVPTSFEYEPRDTRYRLVGRTAEDGDFIEGFDKIFEMNVKKFKNQATFKQRVKLKKKGAKINGFLTFMTCDNEKCLPPEDVDFEYKLNVSDAVGKPAKVVRETPKAEEAPINDMAAVGIGDAATQDGISDPVKWTIKSLKGENGVYELSFTAKIENGWYVYSQDIDDNGPVPTSIEFEENEKVEFLQEKLTEKSEHVKEGFDKLFEMHIKKFAKEVVYSTKVKAKSEDAKLAGTVGFMTCDDEKCLPPEYIDFEFDLKADQTIDLGLLDGGIMPPTGDPTQNTKYKITSVDIDNPVNDCGKEEEKSKSIWGIFILGFLGGLVALLTPCVFPMIPLTVSYFTKGSSGNRSKGIFNAILYGFFILLIYFLFSLPFHIFDSIAPDIFNQISTNVYLNIAFFVIFVVFAISFFGYFEITLPSSIANKADSASDIGGFIGIFFMALTLALVSFSCTGPILGSLLAGALSADGGAIQLTAGMSGFGLALGIPFAIFALFPGMLGSLPKSGGWLNTVKVVLGFVELALAVKFLSNADLVKNWGLLPREIFFGLWILIGIGLAAYLFGLIKFPHDSPIKKLSFPRIGLGVLTAAFVIYLLPGLTNSKYANRQLLSGFPPPLFYSLYDKESNCPLDLNCYKDYEKGLAYAKKVNKPVLLDFTGWACVNCRKMEENVWVKPEIFNKLNDEFVLISLYVDDKRELPEDQVQEYISNTTGKKRKISTKGDVWSTLQTETFVNNSQPYYAILSPNETLLNHPVGYKPDVGDYSSFLDCGLEAFNQIKTSGDTNDKSQLTDKTQTKVASIQ